MDGFLTMSFSRINNLAYVKPAVIQDNQYYVPVIRYAMKTPYYVGQVDLELHYKLMISGVRRR